ncbi:MAG: glycosyltransferase family 4 protein [Acidobacteriota bacterium]|nr:glycosyltransferase family 4 protein [Acidobacteriota bacterium]
MKTLYLCYFGIREPLVQTQVLPYLRELARAGLDVRLLTFEPDHRSWSRAQFDDMRSQLAAEGIGWFHLPYHKRPSLPATLFDILAGALRVASLIRRHNLDVIHARAHVPMAMALLARRLAPCRVVFDIRGLMADEYADAGIWTPGSLQFRSVKWLERVGMRSADQIVVLTKKLRDWIVAEGLASREKIEVIPCCVDFSRFDKVPAIKLEHGKPFEVVYAGSVTGLYLLDSMAEFFMKLKELQPNASLRVLTAARETAENVLTRSGLSKENFSVVTAKPEEVPVYLRQASIGLSFRKPTFSQIGASPTKIPEYLAAGIPVVCNHGVGDTDFISREGVGVVMRSFTPAAYGEAAKDILRLLQQDNIQERCLAVAHSYFDLKKVGQAGYLNVYNRLREARAVHEISLVP